MKIAETVDDQMDAFWDVQAVTAMREIAEEARTHRCPPDMPPCPACEDREEEECYREFGE